jgi:hypothetical protein
MNRAWLVFGFFVFVLTFPAASRAADPTGGEQADPFASPSEGKAPSVEDQEAEVLGAPARPAPPAPPPAPLPRPVPSPRRHAAAQRGDEDRAAAPAVQEADQSGIAIELSTSGFASGTLAGGLFMGGRASNGMILGGLFDYSLTSLSENVAGVDVGTSIQTFRLGFGVRQAFLTTADRRVELYGAGDISFDHQSAEVPSTSGMTPTDSLSASGFSLALGPGLRFWVHDQISIGYLARFRLSYLSGSAGALLSPPVDDTVDGSLTRIGFDGVFQILAVF